MVATGEQVSIGLVALAIQAQKRQGASASWATRCASSPTAPSPRPASRASTRSASSQALKKKQIVVVAGFQGVDEEGNVTTLGRGGSDTTAVALAAALKADACEIYTDVDGVYTTDPNVCPAARKLDRISYEEMLELASVGAKVLQIRSVEFAMKYKVPLWVKSSFTDDPGTLVCEEDASMEDVVVSGIAYDKNEAKIAIRGVPDVPGVAAKIFGALDEKNIVVDLIVQNVSKDGRTDLTFTVGKADLVKAKDVVKKIAKDDQGRGRGDRRSDLQGVHRRRGHAQPLGRGGQDVQGAGRRGHQRADDLHLGDQGVVRDPLQLHGAGGARAAQRVRPGQAQGRGQRLRVRRRLRTPR